MLPSQASGAYGVSFEIDISRGDDLSLKEHWQDHAQAANGNKRAAADADGGKKRRRKPMPKLPKSGTYFETVPFNEDDFKIKGDAAAGIKTR
jgi:hypothetical protein